MACDVFNDALVSDQILKPIDDKSNIYEKIDELAMAKTRANQYASMYSDFPGDKVYSALLADIDRIRNELDQLGAIPSTEEINALFFQEPMQIQGVLIEDFTDFENTFGEVYDLFGISQTVNASYGTFYCYDVVIQDHENHGLLATHIRQGPSAGYDLYAEGSSVKNIIGEEIGKIFFDKAYDIIVSGSRYARILNAAKTALTTIIGMVDSTSPASAVTANGNDYTVEYKDISYQLSANSNIYVTPETTKILDLSPVYQDDTLYIPVNRTDMSCLDLHIRPNYKPYFHNKTMTYNTLYSQNIFLPDALYLHP